MACYIFQRNVLYSHQEQTQCWRVSTTLWLTLALDTKVSSYTSEVFPSSILSCIFTVSLPKPLNYENSSRSDSLDTKLDSLTSPSEFGVL